MEPATCTCVSRYHWTANDSLSVLAGDEPDVRDGKDLRRLALALKVPIITTVAGAVATANALKGLREKPLQHVRTHVLVAVCASCRFQRASSHCSIASMGDTPTTSLS